MIPSNDIFQNPPSDKNLEEYLHHLAQDASLPETIGENPISNLVDQQTPIFIAGAGLMGCSIAAAFLRVGLSVLLYDHIPQALDAAPDRISAELAWQLVDHPEAEPATETLQEARKRVNTLLQTTLDPKEINRSQVILETILEKKKIKQKFYQSIDPLLSEPKILLTNTSTIQITELATSLQNCRNLSAERFCGFHFFHPVRKRSLVEIICSKETSAEVKRTACRIAMEIEKRPLPVSDGPGFLVNRLLNPYLDQAMALLVEGTPIEAIEKAARRFGMEMGPFRIMDEIGLDITMHSGWTFYQAFPERIAAADLLPAMIDDSRLGRKNGRGFLLYDRPGNWDGEGKEDPTLEKVLQKVRKTKTPLSPKEDREIVQRLFGAVLEETKRILQDGIVDTEEEVDRALVYALGFPKSKGGIFYWSRFRSEL